MSDASEKRCAEALAEAQAQLAIIAKLWPTELGPFDYRISTSLEGAVNSLAEHMARCLAVRRIQAADRRCTRSRNHKGKHSTAYNSPIGEPVFEEAQWEP